MQSSYKPQLRGFERDAVTISTATIRMLSRPFTVDALGNRFLPYLVKKSPHVNSDKLRQPFIYDRQI
jgi:hypothetical protein